MSKKIKKLEFEAIMTEIGLPILERLVNSPIHNIDLPHIVFKMCEILEKKEMEFLYKKLFQSKSKLRITIEILE